MIHGMKKRVHEMIALLVLLAGASLLARGNANQSGTGPFTLQGRINTTNPHDGKTYPFKSGRIYLLYCGPVNSLSGDPCLAFSKGAVKELKPEAKATTKNKAQIMKEPADQREDDYAQYYLEAVERGLKAASDETAKHGMGWRMITVSVAEDGRWSQSGLRVGDYKIIARGKLGAFDAEWESIELRFDHEGTATVDLGKPKAVRAIE